MRKHPSFRKRVQNPALSGPRPRGTPVNGAGPRAAGILEDQEGDQSGTATPPRTAKRSKTTASCTPHPMTQTRTARPVPV